MMQFLFLMVVGSTAALVGYCLGRLLAKLIHVAFESLQWIWGKLAVRRYNGTHC